MMLATETFKYCNDAYEYWRDSTERSILFWDAMRKRGNIYLDHLHDGQPPVLVFDHEMIQDGRNFDRPVNYALVRILDRRDEERPDRRQSQRIEIHDQADSDHRGSDRIRRHKTSVARNAPDATSRPIVIIDPRAGHGPGIGGSKQDSQIGMALDAGHPVYFMIFYTDPVPGQTLADVRNAQIKFVEKIRELHPRAPKPAIIGNCQGGWAAALIGAERPDLVGPMVFNGSPLSYWGGIEGVHPMRYLGGLWGGVWINSFLSDLGNNKFDGANLVSNFENLNPANTIWEKQYNLYANIDTEEKRYLDFEKWWGGFFSLSGEEIHTIVDGLFVGNKLEQGEFELDEGRTVDLKHNNNPVVIFASFGDNITPPQQAFNWIIKTYGTVDEIKRRGQVIVCIEHEEIGHLGIFVSAKIARKEHKEIIASFDMLDWLPPGLYRMEIEEDPQEPGEYKVSYFEKKMKDIKTFDDGFEDEKAFYPVRTLSTINDTVYRLTLAPWVKLASNEFTAETLRQMHPMRTQRYLISDLNPWLLPLAFGAMMIKESDNRHPVSKDNVFYQMEKYVSDLITDQLNVYRKMRDGFLENRFKRMYETPWMEIFQPFTSLEETKAVAARLEDLRYQDAMQWREQMGKGDFPEAVIRILLAVGLADQKLERKGYELMTRLIEENKELKDIRIRDLKQMVYSQARLLQTDTDMAINTLPQLLSTPEKRREALALLSKAIKLNEGESKPSEAAVLNKITGALQEEMRRE
ncbi:MAG: DUF3141 domain-containing protein [Desulfosalsimonadaceae bacterium]|nr:DUF3141 domain-containing protein [Desulfosalsimonadaceae bacterium]